MPVIICRMYASRSDADSAVAALREGAIERADIFGATVTEDPSEQALVAAMRRAEIGAADAASYAARVKQGGTLVAVQPPFGEARRAEAILDQYRPIDAGVVRAAPSAEAVAMDKATPFSTWLNWPTLTSNRYPFSTAMNWKLLVAGARLLSDKFGMAFLGRDLISREPAPLSRQLGLRVLSDQATPFSTRFNLRLLRGDPTPLSSRFKWALLKGDRTPFSTRFNLRLLTDNPTPFSSKLGLKLLSERKV
jgi:hypothetical protein